MFINYKILSKTNPLNNYKLSYKKNYNILKQKISEEAETIGSSITWINEQIQDILHKVEQINEDEFDSQGKLDFYNKKLSSLISKQDFERREWEKLQQKVYYFSQMPAPRKKRKISKQNPEQKLK